MGNINREEKKSKSCKKDNEDNKQLDSNNNKREDSYLNDIVTDLLKAYNLAVNLGARFEVEFNQEQKIENNRRKSENEDEFLEESNSTVTFVKDNLCMALMDSLFISTILKYFPLSQEARKYFTLNIFSNFFVTDFVPGLKNAGVKLDAGDIQETFKMFDSLIENKMTTKVEELLNMK